MTLVVVFRCLSPILALPIEWFLSKTKKVGESKRVRQRSSEPYDEDGRRETVRSYI